MGRSEPEREQQPTTPGPVECTNAHSDVIQTTPLRPGNALKYSTMSINLRRKRLAISYQLTR
jgi:hypothetical protein